MIDGNGCVLRILGPVEVWGPAGPVGFIRRQHRDLLAYLLLNSGRVVGVEQMVDAMWGDDVPRTARAQVRNMLSHVRAALAGLPVGIERESAGYRVVVPPDVFDLALVDRLVAASRAAPSPDRAAGLLRQVLQVWADPCPLAGVRAPYAGPARAHLEDRRLSVQEALFDAELASSVPAAATTDLTTELAAVVAAHPGRERFAEQLMIALHREGRPGDALDVYRRARQRMIDEFGLEPGEALKRLQHRILRGDPALRRAPAKPDPAKPDPAAHDGAPGEARPVAAPVVSPASDGIRVLVVDDQILIRAGLVALLRAAPGIAVVGEADDGEEAVRRAASERPDVVLMDVRMPGTDGLSATERIVPLGLKVLVLTTFDLDEYVYRALRAGAHGFLLKNTPPDRLLAALTAVAGGEAIYAPSVLRRLVEAYTERSATRSVLDALTTRERQVLRLLGQGLSNPEIASRLVVTEATVKTHVTRLMAKLGLASRAQAVVMAYESGLVHPAR